MAGFAANVYNAIIRKNPVFLSVIFTSAFAFEMAFDRTIDTVWDSINKGRQWKDIRGKYIETEE